MELPEEVQKKFIRQIVARQNLSRELALLFLDRGRGFGRGDDD